MGRRNRSSEKQGRREFKHGYTREDGKIVVNLRPRNPKYKALLSIDGGGVRGIIPAVILAGFERVAKEVVREMYPEVLKGVSDEDLVVDAKDYFDMVAGNSAGSILALYLASGGGRKELYEKGGALDGMEPGSAAAGVAMVDDLVKQVFQRRWYASIPGVRLLSGLFWSKYGFRGLETALENVFGDVSMSGLHCNTYVPAFELENARPIGFYASKAHDARSLTRSVPGYLYPRDDEPRSSKPGGVQVPNHFETMHVDIPVRVVAQASASAPVYFSPAEYKAPGLASILGLDSDQVSWADGGLVSNNPTIQALAFMASLYSDKKSKRMLSTDRMAVMSLGTGTRRENMRVGGGKGLAPWAGSLVSALMEAHTWVNHQIVDALFDGGLLGRLEDTSDRYIRINRVACKGSPDYDALKELDSYDSVLRLKDIGQELADENHNKMKEFITNILMLEAE